MMFIMFVADWLVSVFASFCMELKILSRDDISPFIDFNITTALAVFSSTVHESLHTEN
jgi:hypothetical protein